MMKTAQLVDDFKNVQIAVIDSRGKPMTVRMPREEAVKLARALLDVLG